MRLSELATRLSAQLIGDGQTSVTGVNTIQDAGPGELCFVLSEKYAGGLAQSRAAAVLLQKPLDGCPMAQLVVRDVQRSMVAVMRLFAPKLDIQQGIHPSAVVDAAAKVDSSASIGPHAVIAAGVTIGASTVIGPGVCIGQNTVIGDRCRLDANVVIYHGCRIGNDCVIQANTTIGSTGFGYYCIDGRHELISHNGGVIIEDNVEIGANSSVDRAKFGNTVIGAGTKIDNQCQVAHNVQIGPHCLLAGQAAIAGSTTLGRYVVMGGRTAAIDNLTVGDMAMFGACAVAKSDIEAGQKVLGDPAQDIKNELKCIAIYQNLPELAKELNQLRRKVEKLEAAKDH
jgi:UDP-3-O-[3-hydroxymyristoyl] glucosamine N-acyltransferase